MTFADTWRRRIKGGIKALLYACACGRERAGVSVLAYHSVDTTGSPLSIAPAEFRDHLALLRQKGWRGLSLAEFVARLNDVPGNRKEVFLTFDDGYENFYTQAAPLLAEFGFPATVFLVTDYVGKEPLWFLRDQTAIARFLGSFAYSDAETAQLVDLMREASKTPLMNWSQARELVRYGIDVQSHSAAHHFLTTLPVPELEADLRRSRTVLEDRLGVSLDLLCYPYGDCDPRVIAVTREIGFHGGLLADYYGPWSDPFRIGRVLLNGTMRPSDVRFALSPAVDYLAALRQRLSTLRSQALYGD